MKSAAKVTVKVEDYKGEVTELTGFKTLKRNQHGNIRGYVGRELVEQFGEDSIRAAAWILETEEPAEIDAFCKKHKLI